MLTLWPADFPLTAISNRARRCLKGRTACAVFHDAARRRRWNQRQRQEMFRLLLQRFGAMLGTMTQGDHRTPATLWRITVESWLRCQRLDRRKSKTKSVNHFSLILVSQLSWAHTFRDTNWPQPPATPSAWFRLRFPAETKQWGCPFLEETVEDGSTGRLTIRAVALNDCFFAAILSDRQLGHSVVFYEPEQQWYYREPRDRCFHPTTEAKLMTLLSALFVKCAEAMPKNIDVENLFVRFREDEQLKAIVKKARSILAADSTFFSADSIHKRIAGPEQPVELARQFVHASVRPHAGRLLSFNQCYNEFAGF